MGRTPAFRRNVMPRTTTRTAAAAPTKSTTSAREKAVEQFAAASEALDEAVEKLDELWALNQTAARAVIAADPVGGWVALSEIDGQSTDELRLMVYERDLGVLTSRG
jgi:hypothetical protein